MLNTLKSIKVNYIQGTITVSGKEQQVTVNDNQVSCNADTTRPLTAEEIDARVQIPRRSINMSIDRNTKQTNVNIVNYTSLEESVTDAKLVETALKAIVEELQTI